MQITKGARVVSLLVLVAVAGITWLVSNEARNQKTAGSKGVNSDAVEATPTVSVRTVPRSDLTRLTNVEPTTPVNNAVQAKVWSIASLPEASTMDSAKMLEKLRALGLDFETETTTSEEFGERRDYVLKGKTFGFVDLSLSYDVAPQGEKLLGLRATIPFSQFESAKKAFAAEKRNAQISHDSPKFVRYDRPDGYALWMKVLDEESADADSDVIGTVKIGLEPAQE